MIFSNYVLPIIAIIVIVVLSGLLFMLKIKWWLRLILNSAFGVAALFAINLLGITFLPINPLNVVLVGFLGVPGMIVAALLYFFL